LEGHAAAERIAHDVRPVQRQVVDEAAMSSAMSPSSIGPVDIGGAAVALQVNGDDLMVVREDGKYRSRTSRSKPRPP
jgi:hypothetical protein